jgi:hypothetical protein
VKSCLAWAFTCGVDWSACEHAIGYLRSPLNAPCFGYYHDKDLVEGRHTGVPFHCLAVDANPATGLILAYGEFSVSIASCAYSARHRARERRLIPAQ